MLAAMAALAILIPPTCCCPRHGCPVAARSSLVLWVFDTAELRVFGAGEYETNETAPTEDEATEVILRALSLGISFLNTSDLYGPFENERRIGVPLLLQCSQDLKTQELQASPLTTCSDDSAAVSYSAVLTTHWHTVTDA